MIREWHHAFDASPHLALQGLTWDEDSGKPARLAFTFTWQLGAAFFEAVREYKHYLLMAWIADVRYRVWCVKLDDDLGPEAFIAEVTRALAQRSIEIATLTEPGAIVYATRYGTFWWRVRDRGLLRQTWHLVYDADDWLGRALRALVEDWRAIRRFTEGETS